MAHVGNFTTAKQRQKDLIAMSIVSPTICQIACELYETYEKLTITFWKYWREGINEAMFKIKSD